MTTALVWVLSLGLGALVCKALLWVGDREEEAERERELRRLGARVGTAPRRAAEANGLDD